MKKLFTLFVTLVATTTLFAGNVIAYTATSKLTETTSQTSSGLHTDAFNVSISNHSYSDGQGIITFSGDVTEVGSKAFYACNSLQTISLPNSVVVIGKYAFSSCKYLTSIDMGSNVVSIGASSFYECNSLQTVSLPNSVSFIGGSAFANCTLLDSITLPDSVKSIENGIFNDCKNLKYVSWGNDINTIGDYVFNGCFALKNIIIPASVSSIGDRAFYYCTSLSDVYSYSEVPPTAWESSFVGIQKHCYLHVPFGFVREYELATGWSQFNHFFEMSALPEGETEVGVKVINNYAYFYWPVNPTANSYTLEIKKEGVIIFTLTFNNMGQLIGIAFAPSRRGSNNVSDAEQTEYGYSFVVTDLEDNCTYEYKFASLDKTSQIIQIKTGTFSTKSGPTTSIEEYPLTDSLVYRSTKVVQDGQLYILRDGKTYTAQGAEVR